MKSKVFDRGMAEAIVNSLFEIFFRQQFIDQQIRAQLKRQTKVWDVPKRAFFTKAIYEVVRHLRWYEVLSKQKLAYKNDLWQYLGYYLALQNQKIPRWSEFDHLKLGDISQRFSNLTKYPAVKYSLPEWLYEIGLESYSPQDWEQILSSLDEPSQIVLRTNTLKTTPSSLQTALKNQKVNTTRIGEMGLMLQDWHHTHGLDLFKEGHFEHQDGASQEVAPFLEVKPGMFVVDACAGAGGKSLHLSALMKNKGRLLALDLYPKKLEELKRRARRAGAFNIETRVIDNSKIIKRLYGKVDRLLLDVPCSGFGVLKRNPDVKWQLEPGFFEELNKTQQAILAKYSKLLKPGGKMVYATCSIFPKENQEQVKQFLESKQDRFLLVKEQQILPQKGFDGFYMAQIERL